ncbi:MAG: TRAP transporter small permease [Proteobacteria bacterium]|nr:TRAP transporter small permease [Pseudomonadota bacterium]
MFGRILKISDTVLTFVEDWTLFLTIIVALIALFANVVMRYGFNHSLAWSEELVRDVIIYSTFIGCSAAIKKQSMIKIDATVQIFPRLKKPLSWFSNCATLVFASMMIWYGSLMAQQQFVTHQKSIIMQVPLVYLYLIMPVTGVMMFLRTLHVMHQDYMGEDEEPRPV